MIPIHHLHMFMHTTGMDCTLYEEQKYILESIASR